jgi:hypothetical protein
MLAALCVYQINEISRKSMNGLYKAPNTEPKLIKRPNSLRWLAWLTWCIVVLAICFFAIIKGAHIYAYSIASGEQAAEIDRVLSGKLGGTLGLFLLFAVPIVLAKLCVSERLPGTKKYKTE